MNYTHLGRTGLKVSRLCLGTMNFGDVTTRRPAPAFWMRRLRRVSISLIQQTCMALNNLPISSKARGCPRKLLVAGFSRVAAVNASFWRQKSISLWDRARTIAGFLLTIFAKPARTVCDGLRPTILTSIRCITSIVIRRGKRSGRPWNCLFSRERFFISVAAISRAGTLRLRSQSPRPVISWAWSPSKVFII